MSETEPFFDTNILVYLISADEAKSGHAEALLVSGGVVSVQVLNEFVAVARRKFQIAVPTIRAILSVVRSVCRVVPSDMETHDLGLALVESHGFSIYDGLVVAAAQLAGCEVLYTEDLQDGQTLDGLTIKNPFKTL